MTDPQADWARCKPWIEAAINESALGDTIERVEEKLANGSYRLVSTALAACLVEYATFNGRKALIVRFGGGDLIDLLDVIQPALYAEAKSCGRLMMAEGRLGWLKPAKERGYKLAWITMVKD